eukprot:6208759-Pleurochrysis_carterae.AAC.1
MPSHLHSARLCRRPRTSEPLGIRPPVVSSMRKTCASVPTWHVQSDPLMLSTKRNRCPRLQSRQSSWATTCARTSGATLYMSSQHDVRSSLQRPVKSAARLCGTKFLFRASAPFMPKANGSRH